MRHAILLHEGTVTNSFLSSRSFFIRKPIQAQSQTLYHFLIMPTSEEVNPSFYVLSWKVEDKNVSYLNVAGVGFIVAVLQVLFLVIWA